MEDIYWGGMLLVAGILGVCNYCPYSDHRGHYRLMAYTKVMRFVFIWIALLGGLLLWMPYDARAVVQCSDNDDCQLGEYCGGCDEHGCQCLDSSNFGNFEVGIPGIAEEGESIDAFARRDYPLVILFGSLAGIITAAIVAVGLIAIVFGGYVYMTAGGSAERVGTAKAIIGSALFGIALALFAYAMLNRISPQFTPVLP